MSDFSTLPLSGGAIYTAEYDTTGMQESFAAPYVKSGFTAQLTPVGGAANLQISIDGTNWKTWDSGDVTETEISYVRAVRFFRVENVSATSSSITIWGY